ncbi:MAG: replication initiator protein A [Paraclostridium sp.]
MRAIKKDDLENVIFYQVPKWLMELFIKGFISQGAFKTYVLMFDRVRLSSKNNWIDDNEDVYIKYSYDEMQKDLDCSRQAISNNLKDLVNCNLIDKKRQFNSSTIFYLNISSVENFTSQEKLTSISKENFTNESKENLTNSSLENLDSSKNNLIKNNYKKNNLNKSDLIVEIQSLEIGEELKTKLIEFFNFRKELKKPIKTMSSINKLISSIGKTFTDESDLMECIDNSIMNGYQGVFPNKSKKTEVKKKSFAQRELERLEAEEKNKKKWRQL